MLYVIYGVVFIVILTLAFATLVLDLLYPLLDPRIRQGREMSTLVGNPQHEAVPQDIGVGQERLANFGAYLRRNPSLGIGLTIVILLIAIGIVGHR
ncbi:MAG: hypothetical protein U0232_07900 [Thermomicrobiales bacterium]